MSKHTSTSRKSSSPSKSPDSPASSIRVKTEPPSPKSSATRSSSPSTSPASKKKAGRKKKDDSHEAAVKKEPATTKRRGRKRAVKQEENEEDEEDEEDEDEDEDEEYEDEHKSTTRVKKEKKEPRAKRVKHESAASSVKSEPMSDDDHSEAAVSSQANGHSASSTSNEVNMDRVRILKPDGKRVEVDPDSFNWKHSGVKKEGSRAAASSSSSSSSGGGSVVYWMTRDQRVQDNWSMLYARQLAREHGAHLRVIFSLVPKFLEATERQYSFMLNGLQEVERELKELKIPFEILIGFAWETLPKYVKQHQAGAVVTDYGPLRISKDWTKKVAKELEKLPIPLFVVDSHNVVPVWIASSKLEYAARTIRPKIHRHLNNFLTDFPRLEPNHVTGDVTAEMLRVDPIDWRHLDSTLEIDRRVKAVESIKPGTAAAFDVLHSFIRSRLHHFDTKRNDPNARHVSGMSPYLHFGQIAPQRCAFEVNKYRGRFSSGVNSFIEELVVRRELSDNHCEYNEKYDSIDGASEWARASLLKHADDKRAFLYTLGEFEFGVTHDELWNASQLQMMHEGKMHGFLRMYWCKKILEWSPSPQMALETSIYLNDRYHIDGRDPNGYVGCGWSIIGTHDMGWAERPIFGKIRFMSFDGCKRKFDVPAFVRAYQRHGSKVGSPEYHRNQERARDRDDELRRRREGGSNGSASRDPVPDRLVEAASDMNDTSSVADAVDEKLTSTDATDDANRTATMEEVASSHEPTPAAASSSKSRKR